MGPDRKVGGVAPGLSATELKRVSCDEREEVNESECGFGGLPKGMVTPFVQLLLCQT